MTAVVEAWRVRSGTTAAAPSPLTPAVSLLRTNLQSIGKLSPMHPCSVRFEYMSFFTVLWFVFTRIGFTLYLTCNYMSKRRALSSRLFQGGRMKLSRGTIEWPKATSRCAKRRAEEGSGQGCPPPQGWGSGLSPRENFEIWDAIWCNMVHFGKLMFLQFSTWTKTLP